MAIRVLLVDDHRIITDSLSLLLASIDGLEVVGCLNDSREVVPFLEKQPVDVLLTDLTMPYHDGIQLTFAVRNQFPTIKVLLLTVQNEANAIRDAYRAGAAGYVLKRTGRAELEHALRTVAAGGHYFVNDVLREVLAAQPPDTIAPAPPPIRLTEREIDIVRLMAQEYSTNQIADQLNLSSGTVETHRHNIMRKLGVRNMVGIIKYAIRYQLI